MAIINSKTAARIAAIQSMYQFESNGRVDNAAALSQKIESSYNSEDFKELFDIPNNVSVKLHTNHSRALISNTIDNLEKIDEIISSNLTGNWQFSNLHFSLLALLRVGVAEIIYFPDTPAKVVVNEFTNIGSSLAKASEVPFINSLLDKVNKEYRVVNEQNLEK
ncbi:MAG UNVERIFIED_CONTAM: transcription antitermination factor NusB [Rickettsiaceae bacterium]|jgi:N utilization substance protein B